MALCLDSCAVGTSTYQSIAMEVLKNTFAVFAALFIIGINCEPTSKYFAPCKIDDQECMINIFRILKRLATTGAPEFDLEPFDPMTIKNATMSVPGVATFNVIEAILRGQSKCIYVSSLISIEQLNGSIGFECSFSLNGTYEAYFEKPILLGLPLRKSVVGKGEFSIETVNTKLLAEFTLNLAKDAEGIIRIEYRDGDVLYDVHKEGHDVKIHMTGLKSGEVNVDSLINKVFWKNWKSFTTVFFPSFLNERLITILGPELKMLFKLPFNNFISDDLEQYVNKLIK